MRWLISLGLAAAVVGAASLATAPAAAPPTSAPAAGDSGDLITVMSRNLYLGADIGVALDLLPDLSAAAQFLWDQVQITDFDTRAGLLAAEAAQHRPAVIGVQEATRWLCTTSPLRSPVAVYDFTADFLSAAAAAGTPYEVAAANPGYRIGPLPRLTVTDPDTFQPLFGADRADCGFEIGDALLVRSDLAGQVRRAGTSEYEAREVIVPTVLAIDRGYAWADIDLAATTVRFVTTHLESLWEPGRVTTASVQAEQLVEDLVGTTGPLIVMGDFNSDPRDPRPPGAPNPAEQPTASDACPAQPEAPTVQDARSECSPYWIMRRAGYLSAGPEATDPSGYSFGASVLLAGPDPDRLRAALDMGNSSGFTDRLDYVFVRNGVLLDTGETVGGGWPFGAQTWSCDAPEQVANTAAAAAVLAEAGRDVPPSGAGVCLPSDHAGLVASVHVDGTTSAAADDPPTEHHPFRLVWWHIALGLLFLAGGGIWLLIRRRRRARVSPEPAPH